MSDTPKQIFAIDRSEFASSSPEQHPDRGGADPHLVRDFLVRRAERCVMQGFTLARRERARADACDLGGLHPAKENVVLGPNRDLFEDLPAPHQRMADAFLGGSGSLRASIEGIDDLSQQATARL